MISILPLFGFLTVLFVTVSNAAPTTPPTNASDVQPGDWTYKQAYEYIVQQNDSSAAAISPVLQDYIEKNGGCWDKIYDGEFTLPDGGPVMTVAKSAHARSLQSGGTLTKRSFNGYVTSYPWSNNCDGQVGWTWYRNGGDGCYTDDVNGQPIRMYSVYANSYHNINGVSNRVYLSQNYDCSNSFIFYDFDSSGCFGTSGGTGFMSFYV
jgi:hypothetical protein